MSSSGLPDTGFQVRVVGFSLKFRIAFIFVEKFLEIFSELRTFSDFYSFVQIFHTFFNKPLPNSSRLEPVGSVSPKIQVGDEFKLLKVKSGEHINLLCPAQAYPTPIFRYGRVVSPNFEARSTSLIKFLSHCLPCLDEKALFLLSRTCWLGQPENTRRR